MSDKQKFEKVFHLDRKKKSWLRLHKKLPSHLLTNTVVKDLWTLCPKNQSIIKFMGKEVKIPRFQQTFSDVVSHYRFSGVDHKSLPIPPFLEPFFTFANSLDEKMKFNVCFVNWYRNGKDYISFHSDNEKQLYKDEEGNIDILSISIGQTRRFVLKPNDPELGFKKEISLENGSVISMGGHCQSTHKHSIPKITKKVDDTSERINLTFRRFVV
jgi:alkylated DNA repair dioxygenase AlkB